MSWETHPDGRPNDGFIDFADIFDGAEWQVAYAWTTVTAEAGGEVELRVGSHDDVKVWVNSIEAPIPPVGRPAAPNQGRAHHVILKRGENQILVKVCNREGEWGFDLRFTDENRRPAKGLTYRR